MKSQVQFRAAEDHEVQSMQLTGSNLVASRNLQWQIQRRACRADFLTGNLEQQGTASRTNSLSRENLLATPAERRPLLEAYLQQQVAQVLKVSQSQVDFQQPLSVWPRLHGLRA